MEIAIPNFENLYKAFENNFENLEITIFQTENLQEKNRLQQIQLELKTLDVKMRLAFGIREIRLNNNFVSDKRDDLKLCHLLYYKLADLWFAYETYLKLYLKITGTQKNNVDWIDAATHTPYSSTPEIIFAQTSLNEEFLNYYSNEPKRNLFLQYLEYCKVSASHSQRRRLDRVIVKIQQQTFDLTNSEILAIVYGVRNNFVHNGETTVVPDLFGYENKAELLKSLYRFLCIIVLLATNTTLNRI